MLIVQKQIITRKSENRINFLKACNLTRWLNCFKVSFCYDVFIAEGFNVDQIFPPIPFVIVLVAP